MAWPCFLIRVSISWSPQLSVLNHHTISTATMHVTVSSTTLHRWNLWETYLEWLIRLSPVQTSACCSLSHSHPTLYKNWQVTLRDLRARLSWSHFKSISYSYGMGSVSVGVSGGWQESCQGCVLLHLGAIAISDMHAAGFKSISQPPCLLLPSPLLHPCNNTLCISFPPPSPHLVTPGPQALLICLLWDSIYSLARCD